MAIKSMTRHLFLLLLSFSLNCNALRTASRSGCVSNVDYATAVAHCASLSGELCTQNEIVAQRLGHNSGCIFDCHHTWTATSCAVDSHWIAATGSEPDNSDCPQATIPSVYVCSLDTATQSPSLNTAIVVVCCFETGDPSEECAEQGAAFDPFHECSCVTEDECAGKNGGYFCNPIAKVNDDLGGAAGAVSDPCTDDSVCCCHCKGFCADGN